MTTAREQKKFQKALAEAAKVFEGIDLSVIQLPMESTSDIIREAASVIAYFDLKEQFREETCRHCGRVFAYSYYMTAVKCCSIPCMAGVLESMGLRWDHNAPLERRWGPRGVPAIVPAVALEVIKQQAPEPEVPEPVTTNGNTNAIGAADLMARLQRLVEEREHPT